MNTLKIFDPGSMHVLEYLEFYSICELYMSVIVRCMNKEKSLIEWSDL